MEFQQEELNEILNIFQQESMEIIASMDEKLLTIGNGEFNPELAMQLFRDAHSLKGSARMLGFEGIQNVAHKIEDVISLVKEEKLTLTSDISDTISQCLEFISDLINKTVEQKEEYKSPDIEKYIEKLIKIVKDTEENFHEKKPNDEPDADKRDFLEKFPKIEELTLNILTLISMSRKNHDFEKLKEIEEDVNLLIFLLKDNENAKIKEIFSNAKSVIRQIEEFTQAQNKDLSFLEVNSATTILVESICNYIDKEHIKRKDYFDIVDRKLNEITNQEEIRPKQEIKYLNDDKTTEIVQRLPLMELNCSFYDETIELINTMITSETNPKIKEVYDIVKEIIYIYKVASKTFTKDVSQAIKETLESLKNAEPKIIEQAHQKIDVIRTMAKFQCKNEHHKPKELTNTESGQREFLNTITNTEIKTLRVDSIKLDNLVGQIRELIVSKIKTNEQLSLAKKINYDMAEWQKNFAKMGYYIKYFDKKYLSNPQGHEEWDYRTVSAYNNQLYSLAEQHTDKITALIKEMNYLFKQLQESETKLNSTTSEIENMVKNMRILPLSTIFQLFPRMIHNIAKEKNKKIDVVINGSDVSADKTIIEEIKIPLMHIIRNSIDHGIETVDIRKAKGKNPIGKIEINASLKDSKVIIDVKDDGKGLDIEKIKKKALEMKILTKEELGAISDEELTNLIFYPGFSTEDFVTELSGRGLGLDIVNNKINQLQGRIDIFSQINNGTLTRITLPATVATKKVFILEEQEQLYAIETSVIKTIVRINSDEIFEKDGKNYYIYGNSAIAVYTLSQILNPENVSKETNKYTLMIIEVDNSLFGIIVEKLISDQEIVHKKLSAPLYKVKNISGITTLANGEACLILNVADIISTINSTKIGTKIISKNGIIKTRDNYKYKILIVDDSHTTRILQKNILANKGYNVSIATNPQNALEKVAQNKFDVIISDIQMPGMNGIQFVSKLRNMKEYKTCPVVIVSSEPFEHYKNDVERYNIANYIQKNTFKQENLLSIIENLLKD